MPAYLVRTIHSLRLVGVFVARDPSQLYEVVDEVLDPSNCEYFKMNNLDGVFLGGQFTAEVEGGGAPTAPGEDLYVYLRPAPEGEATEPELSENLSARLDKGRSWNTFTDENFAEAFGLTADVMNAGEEVSA
jgi:hypothetical protein